MQPFDSVTAIEQAEPLDPVVQRVRSLVSSVLGPGSVRDALHGVWLGHPLHPSLVQVSIGALMSASMLDLAPGNESASEALIATGLLSAGPSAATGCADWSELHEEQQRVGLVHAVLNLAGLTAYGVSLAARLAGRQSAGRTLGFAGLGLLGAGGFLGGHLSFRQAAGANHTEDIPYLVTPGWLDVCAVDDLPPDGEPTRFHLAGSRGEVPVVLVRQADRIDVLSDRCSHLSGPLSEGTLSHGDQCITCPWHGSAFYLDDGAVREGPATAPVPSFDVKVEDGQVRVRLPGAR